MSRSKILVLGATGLLGTDLVPFLDSSGYEVSTHGRNFADYKFDLKSGNDVTRYLDEISPHYVINLVGLTDVDYCEREPNEAYIGNVLTVENVSNWVFKKNGRAHLIHISTDQVYDGIGSHTEQDITLTNYYAFSKYAGELHAKKAGATILRTNFFGKSHCERRVSLSDWIYYALISKDFIQVFDDVKFSPLSMSTLARMILVCLEKRPPGVFNVGSKNGLSKADFAFSLARHLKLDVDNVQRTTTNQVNFLKTYRPKDMRMDSTLFETELGIKLPSLEDEIISVAKGY
jgi:dTDP-4-dehydrorhamnose reductase